MSTARDLLIVTMDMPSSRPVERGDLSLALAGAELVDLVRAGAVTLKGERVQPQPPRAIADRLLAEAAASETVEPVNEWLWRRGRGLAAAYLAAFEAEGQLTRQRRRRWGVLWTSEMVLVDSPSRRRAANRWAADEPVLAALAATVGITDKRTGDSEVADDAAQTVLAAVTDAVAELAGERERRARKLDDAAVTNYRRGY
jgi:Golgi phosphoprotein 3 (GPP34)